MKFQDKDKGERDLFGQVHAGDKKIKKKTRFFLPRMKNSAPLSCENIIIIVIGFVMSCIIFFSLGVEKGRQDMNRGQKTEDRRQRTEDRGQKTEETGDIQQDRYVIQLAAYRRRDSAEKEQEDLQTNGYRADIKKSGDYYLLYIGGLNSKPEAEEMLKILKRRYKDCYIKKRD